MTVLDLYMTVRAEEDALRGLRSECLEAPHQAPSTDREALGVRVDVVKLQRGRQAVVPAQHAGTASLLDERSLRSLAPACHRFDPASDTGPRPVRPDDELRCTVVVANPWLANQRIGEHAPAAASCGRPQPVMLEPVSRRRGTARDPFGDLANAQVLLDPLREDVPGHRPARPVALAA